MNPSSIHWIFFLLLVCSSTRCHGHRNPDEQLSNFEGDVAVASNQVAAVSPDAIVTKKVKPWPHRVIPFLLSPEIQTLPKEAETIYGAMLELMDRTCIRFIPRTRQPNYINIQLGRTCASSVGEVGGRQNITLRLSENPSTNCVSHGEVLHELMHAVGFWHEQNRPDRDNYINIFYRNLRKRARELDFKVHMGMDTFNLPYDYSSILHYSAQAFQRNPAVSTLEAKVESAPIGIRNHLSHLDKVKVNLLYRCSPPTD